MENDFISKEDLDILYKFGFQIGKKALNKNNKGLKHQWNTFILSYPTKFYNDVLELANKHNIELPSEFNIYMSVAHMQCIMIGIHNGSLVD